MAFEWLTAAKAKKGRALVMASLVLSFVVVDASGAGVTYTYDPIGRVGAGFYDNGMCLAYTYDAAGNRTSRTNGSISSPVWGGAPWGCLTWSP